MDTSVFVFARSCSVKGCACGGLTNGSSFDDFFFDHVPALCIPRDIGLCVACLLACSPAEVLGRCGECACASKPGVRVAGSGCTGVLDLSNIRAFGHAMPECSSICLGACWNEKATTSRNLSNALPWPLPRLTPSAMTIRIRPRSSLASQCDCCRTWASKGGNRSCLENSAEVVGPPVVSMLKSAVYTMLWSVRAHQLLLANHSVPQDISVPSSCHQRRALLRR